MDLVQTKIYMIINQEFEFFNMLELDRLNKE